MSALPLRRKKSDCLLVWHGNLPWKSSGNVAYIPQQSSNVVKCERTRLWRTHWGRHSPSSYGCLVVHIFWGEIHRSDSFSVLALTHPTVHQTGRVCQCLQDRLLQSGTQWFELHSPDRQFRIASPALDWLRTGWAGSGTGFLALDLWNGSRFVENQSGVFLMQAEVTNWRRGKSEDSECKKKMKPASTTSCLALTEGRWG